MYVVEEVECIDKVTMQAQSFDRCQQRQDKYLEFLLDAVGDRLLSLCLLERKEKSVSFSQPS